MSRLLTSSFAGLTILSASAAVLWPGAGDTVAVFAWPGSSRTRTLEIVAAAGGSILDSAWRNRIVLARSDAADFPRRLYAAGAGLVLRADAAGCAAGSAPGART